MPTSRELEFIQRIHTKLLEYLSRNNDKMVHSMISIEDILSRYDLTIEGSSDLEDLELFIDGYLDL